jgi:hypothetical protein
MGGACTTQNLKAIDSLEDLGIHGGRRMMMMMMIIIGLN